MKYSVNLMGDQCWGNSINLPSLSPLPTSREGKVGWVACIFFLLFLSSLLWGQTTNKNEVAADPNDFVIKKPGEITFTSGIIIEGRVEKPQVLLIMTKEKTKLPALKLNSSMIRFIEEPVNINSAQIKE